MLRGKLVLAAVLIRPRPPVVSIVIEAALGPSLALDPSVDPAEWLALVSLNAPQPARAPSSTSLSSCEAIDAFLSAIPNRSRTEALVDAAAALLARTTLYHHTEKAEIDLGLEQAQEPTLQLLVPNARQTGIEHRADQA